MSDVYRVEPDLSRMRQDPSKKLQAHDRDKEPYIGLGERVADEIWFIRQQLLDAVQALKERVDSPLIRLLRACKATLVHTVCIEVRSNDEHGRSNVRTVHGVVHPFVDLVNLGAVLRGVDIERGLLRREQRVERGVEDADDLGAFIVDDRVRFLVPEHRDGKPVQRWVEQSW